MVGLQSFRWCAGEPQDFLCDEVQFSALETQSTSFCKDDRFRRSGQLQMGLWKLCRGSILPWIPQGVRIADSTFLCLLTNHHSSHVHVVSSIHPEHVWSTSTYPSAQSVLVVTSPNPSSTSASLRTCTWSRCASISTPRAWPTSSWLNVGHILLRRIQAIHTHLQKIYIIVGYSALHPRPWYNSGPVLGSTASLIARTCWSFYRYLIEIPGAVILASGLRMPRTG